MYIVHCTYIVNTYFEKVNNLYFSLSLSLSISLSLSLAQARLHTLFLKQMRATQ